MTAETDQQVTGQNVTEGVVPGYAEAAAAQQTGVPAQVAEATVMGNGVAMAALQRSMDYRW